MQLYKLTSQDGRTIAGRQWGENIEHTVPGEVDLDGPKWIHAYTDPLLAAFFSPVFHNFDDPVLWKAEGDVAQTHYGVKVVCTRLKTIAQIPLPQITAEQRVRFAIRCTWHVCEDPDWRAWAGRWLSGEDRSPYAMREAWGATAEQLEKIEQPRRKGNAVETSQSLVVAWSALSAAHWSAWAAWAAQGCGRAGEVAWSAAWAAVSALCAQAMMLKQGTVEKAIFDPLDIARLVLEEKA